MTEDEDFKFEPMVAAKKRLQGKNPPERSEPNRDAAAAPSEHRSCRPEK
jgi:hypothetical protein